MRFRVYTGPVGVHEIAERVRKAGAEVMEGTEHVYVTTDDLAALRARCDEGTRRILDPDARIGAPGYRCVVQIAS